jgi:hypothetical protein
VNNKPSTCKYEPVIDGNYIPDITTKLLAAGKFTKVTPFSYEETVSDAEIHAHKVPILAGHNAQDGSIFVGTPASIVTDADIITAILKRYPGLVRCPSFIFVADPDRRVCAPPADNAYRRAARHLPSRIEHHALDDSVGARDVRLHGERGWFELFILGAHFSCSLKLACWDYYIGNISGKPAFNYRWDAPDPNLLAARGAYVGAAHT